MSLRFLDRMRVVPDPWIPGMATGQLRGETGEHGLEFAADVPSSTAPVEGGGAIWRADCALFRHPTGPIGRPRNRIGRSPPPQSDARPPAGAA